MNTATLRRAASLMHERARAALGPDYEWGIDEDGESRRTWWAFTDEAHLCANGILTVRDMPPWADRVVMFEHVTGWTPAVALAVAAWLDIEAAKWQQLYDDTQAPSRGIDQPPAVNYGNPTAARENADHHCRAALTVARAYLGDHDA